MPTANITVETIYAPGENGKMYRLIGDDKEAYFVWADKIDMYQEGGNYDLSYTDKAVAPGKTIKIVNSPGGKGAPAAAPRPAARAPRPHPIQAQAAPAAKTYSPPPTGQHDEHIFVALCIKEAIRGQLLDPFNGEEIVRLGKIAKHAHKLIWATVNKPPQAQVDDDMNDSIPF